jgi:hypothetical protein
MSGRPTIRVRAWLSGQPREIEVSGQTAKALLALVSADGRGVTALECATWAYWLAAYCHELRHRSGLAIRTARENHPGGWHGRHVLETPVEILAVEGFQGLAA